RDPSIIDRLTTCEGGNGEQGWESLTSFFRAKMVLSFFKRLFKARGKYTINAGDDEIDRRPTTVSIVFPVETESLPKLVRSVPTPISPLLYRQIFNQYDSDHDEDRVSRQCCTRASTTSSAGYGSQSSEESGGGGARLGGSSESDGAEIHIYSVESSPVQEVVRHVSVWPECDYSTESVAAAKPDILSPVSIAENTPFVCYGNRKRSLRRMPSAPVSGKVKQMVRFFESDSDRAEVPRRLDQVPPEFMRSAPQMNCTPTPTRTTHDNHIHSDVIRAFTKSTDCCIRRHFPPYRTPKSRKAVV
ncbi:hypothetical protein PFISCL1PPCAC_3548, partial [Pristionchus fissidentatus]